MDIYERLNHLSVIDNQEETLDVSMDDYSDVSMKDYVPTEIEDQLMVNEIAGQEPSEPVDLHINNTSKDTDNVDVENISDDANQNSLVTAILKPESQGFKMGLQSQQNFKPPENQIRNEVGPYVIHNHFYNNIFSYPTDSKSSQSLVGNEMGKLIGCQDFREDEESIENENKSRYMFHYIDHIKQSINYGIVIFFLILLFRNIKSDILYEYERLEHLKSLKIEQCKKEYIINKCDQFGQLPALKDMCLEWSLCFSDEFHPEKTVFYTELVFQVIGRLLNGFLETLGNINKAFLVIIVFVWYFGNFLCGYYKGNKTLANMEMKKNE